MSISVKRLIASCMIGNAMEWYDFALYGYFLPIIMKNLLPPSGKAVFFQGFWVFFLGFLTRPLGGLFFGYIGDRWGRQKALMGSIYAMLLATLCIGCLPSFAAMGWTGFWLLTLCRMIQGLAMGGEFSGSMIMVVENVSKRTYLWGSFVSLSALMGLLLGSLMTGLSANLFSEDLLHQWGWRIPFLLSIFGGGAGILMRRQHPVENSHQSFSGGIFSWKSLKSFLGLLVENRQYLWKIMAIDSVVAVGFFMITTYLFNHILFLKSLSYAQAALCNLVGVLAFSFSIPIAGFLADRYGGKRIIFLGILALMALAFPGFYALSSFQMHWIYMGFLMLAFPMGLIFGPLPGLLVPILPSEIRYSGLSVAHNTSMSLLGGISPLAATYLLEKTQWPLAPAILLFLAGGVSIFGLKMGKSRKFNEK